MKGIRVHSVGFAEMIAPVLQPLGEFTVFSGSFGIPLDGSLDSEEEIEAFEEAWLAKLRKYSLSGEPDLEEGTLFKPGALSLFAPAVSNDWNEVLFFEGEGVTREQILQPPGQGSSPGEWEYLKGHCEARRKIESLNPCVILNNWDGLYWQLFTLRKTILNPVVSNAERKGWKWEIVEFDTQYPDPSDVALAYALRDYQRRTGPAAAQGQDNASASTRAAQE